MTVAWSLPGMVIGSGAQVESTSASLDRAGRNVWWLRLTDPRQPTPPIVDDFETLLPSDALARWSESGLEGDAIAVKVELDVCGAWLTVANAGDARPVLVRRAGWVELRGHPSPPLGGQWIGSDDRIGLGPADMLLVPVGSGRRSDGDTDNTPLDALLDRSLRAAGTDPTELLRAVGEIAQGERCVGIGVPADLGADPVQRVARAMEVRPEKVVSPGYPLGDLQPDLWKEPPPPPRAARLRLSQDRSSVSGVRSLLDRLLGSWRLDGRIDDGDLKLVATELAANAVVHTGVPDTITIRYLGDRIRIEVRDRSADQPAPREAGAGSESGRGMHLVGALSENWGVESIGGGKQVWCELGLRASS